LILIYVRRVIYCYTEIRLDMSEGRITLNEGAWLALNQRHYIAASNVCTMEVLVSRNLTLPRKTGVPFEGFLHLKKKKKKPTQ